MSVVPRIIGRLASVIETEVTDRVIVSRFSSMNASDRGELEDLFWMKVGECEEAVEKITLLYGPGEAAVALSRILARISATNTRKSLTAKKEASE